MKKGDLADHYGALKAKQTQLTSELESLKSMMTKRFMKKDSALLEGKKFKVTLSEKSRWTISQGSVVEQLVLDNLVPTKGLAEEFVDKCVKESTFVVAYTKAIR
jgi:hypothetical protein